MQKIDHAFLYSGLFGVPIRRKHSNSIKENSLDRKDNIALLGGMKNDKISPVIWWRTYPCKSMTNKNLSFIPIPVLIIVISILFLFMDTYLKNGGELSDG